MSPLQETLQLETHPEGGFFRRIHTNPLDISLSLIPPVIPTSSPTISASEQRPLSTSIHYLLTSSSSLCVFHRNTRSTSYHFHHQGRGQAILLYPPSNISSSPFSSTHQTPLPKTKIESFVIGSNIRNHERVSCVVPPGVWKCFFISPPSSTRQEFDDVESCTFPPTTNYETKEENGENAEGQRNEDEWLMSEVVIPGFSFDDHEFLDWDGLVSLVGISIADRWKGLLVSPLPPTPTSRDFVAVDRKID